MTSRRSTQILGCGVFLVAYGTNVSTPFLVTYRERLDLGDSATMAIFTVYVIGIMSVVPFAGQLSDRHGRKTLAVPFVAISVAASLIMILGRDSLGFLLLGRLLLGAISGGVLSVGAAWLQELLGPGKEQRAAVISTLVSYGGFGIGPPISALFHELDLAPLVLPFLVHAVATALIVPLMLRLPETAGRSTAPVRLKLGVPANGHRMFMRTIAPATIWVFGFPSTSFALFPVIISDAVDGSPVVVAAASAALTAWAALVARPLLPRLGAERTLHLGMIGGTIGYGFGALAFATDIWPLVLPAAALLGGASGLLTAGALALLNQIADDDTRGSINATFYLLAYPGMTMPLILTAAASIIGLSTALIALMVIAASISVFLVRQPIHP